jgi:anti-anti-sigma regulatory factor
MAKYRHRYFEMYDLRDEAIQAMMSKTEKVATEATAPESWDFGHLEVSRKADVICVHFKVPQNFEDGATSDLRDDLARLADLLGRDSRVLLDFSGVVSFNSASISALVQFNRNLQIKGSRMALCRLSPATRQSFFVVP